MTQYIWLKTNFHPTVIAGTANLSRGRTTFKRFPGSSGDLDMRSKHSRIDTPTDPWGNKKSKLPVLRCFDGFYFCYKVRYRLTVKAGTRGSTLHAILQCWMVYNVCKEILRWRNMRKNFLSNYRLVKVQPQQVSLITLLCQAILCPNPNFIRC